MAAFNLIHINAQCPNCGEIIDIECQTHVASSFDGIGAKRFCAEVYHVGDLMNWYDSQHPLYESWKQGNSKIELPGNTDAECCYATCSICNTECFVLIYFQDCTILKIDRIGQIEDWPNEFYK